MGVTFLKEGREWRMPIILYADDLALCGESEEDMEVTMIGRDYSMCHCMVMRQWYRGRRGIGGIVLRLCR